MSAEPPAANGIVPPMVKFSGVLTDVNGKPMTGVVGVTFCLYKDSQGGAPLWMETQNVQSDKNGHYTVMLGSTSSQGLPPGLFVSGEARWLGVQAQGQTEQPRTMLMSVPYALKAADAETLGGKPLSAFQLATPQSNGSSAQKAQAATEQPNEIICAGSAACKASFIPRFSSNGGSAKVSDSIIRQSGSTIAIAGNLGLAGNVSASSATVANGSGAAIVGTSHGTSGGSDGVDGFTTSASASGVAGINQSGGIGVYGTGGTGVFGTGSAYGFTTDSNVQQARTMGGWVKAMVFYDGPDDVIVSCFNSTLPGANATTPPCGFATHKWGTGDYTIDAGFEIDDRLFSLSPQNWQGVGPVGLGICTDLVPFGPCPNTITANQAEILAHAVNGNFTEALFYLIVY
jgi:hypothetical protein